MNLLSMADRLRRLAWVGYVLAVLISLAALIIRLQLGAAFPGFPFLTFFGAVVLVVFLGGRNPGLLTVAITALMADYYLIEPTGTFAVNVPSGAIGLSIYVLITLCLVSLMDSLLKAQSREELTEELLAQRALFESEQRFRILIQGVRDYAIYMLDPSGHVSNWNSGAQLIKGYAADEIVGQHFSRFYTEADRSNGEPERALKTALETGKYEREARRVRKDGSLFWASVVIDPIFDDAGNHIGFAKITRDISERKQRDLELEQARETIAQTQKLQALGELTGGIAHDFNNLMTVIVGSTDFLLKHPDLPSTKRHKYLQSVAQTASRATDLTNHLLTFARRQSLKPEVIDLRFRLDEFAEMIGRLLGSRIRIKVENKAEDPFVEVDAAQLDTALLNAAVNARDAMPDGGELHLITSDCQLEGKRAICIAVSDTGTGIPGDELSRVFEPFFTTKALGKGTGLGLSQIHGFAAQAGGIARIQSELGRGTTLELLLPRTDKTREEGASSQALAEFPSGLKILLVEDNPDVQQFALKLLEDSGCHVVTTEDGLQAMEKLRHAQFDLVFSDVMMPKMSGLELANSMRAEKIETPLVLCTGYSNELVGTLPEDIAIVRKPYDVATLLDAILAKLGGRSG